MSGNGSMIRQDVSARFSFLVKLSRSPPDYYGERTSAAITSADPIVVTVASVIIVVVKVSVRQIAGNALTVKTRIWNPESVDIAIIPKIVMVNAVVVSVIYPLPTDANYTITSIGHPTCA